MRKARKLRWENPFLFVCFIVLGAILGALMLQKYHERHDIPPKVVLPAPQEAGVVILYFSSPEGDRLLPEARRIGPCPDVEHCIVAVVDELVNGPLGELSSTLPAGTVFRSVAVEGDTVAIDWGSGLRDGLPTGSSAEMMAAYSVVNTIVENFPDIKRVRFLIEGEPVPTLKGHLDLREPLEADFSLSEAQK